MTQWLKPLTKIFGFGKKEEVAKEVAKVEEEIPITPPQPEPSPEYIAELPKRKRGRPKQETLAARPEVTPRREITLKEKHAPEAYVNTYRLTPEQQSILTQMIANYVPDGEIINYFHQEHGIEITYSAIYKYRKSPIWKPKIEEFRKQFEADLSDEELASKRRRIQEYSRIYRLCEEHENFTKAADMLSKIREEIEGKTYGQTTITQYNQYNSMNDEEIRRFIEENNRFIQIAEKRKAAITVTPEESSVEGN